MKNETDFNEFMISWNNGNKEQVLNEFYHLTGVEREQFLNYVVNHWNAIATQVFKHLLAFAN